MLLQESQAVQRTLILPVYVDDLLPIGDKILCDDFEKWIPKYFNVAITCDVSLFLGIRVIRDRTAIPPFFSIDQEVYACKIITRSGINLNKQPTTPLPVQEKLTKSDGMMDRETTKIYQTAIGSLMYLMLRTRPDLTYSVGKLSRFSSNPLDEHVDAVIRVLQYVYMTSDLCQKYSQQNRENSLNPYGFTDSDWAADVSDS